MRLQRQWWSGLAAAVLMGLVGVTAVAAAGAQFLPVLSVREGANRSIGVPIAHGFIDYMTVLNERNGGINGVPLVWEECETVYDATRGIECYERLNAQGSTGAAVFPLSDTPIVNALIARATHDQLPRLAVGVGRSDAADGRVFPYVFNPPKSWWSENTAKSRFIGQRAGGMAQLKGRTIVHVHVDHESGQKTIPLLDQQAGPLRLYGATLGRATAGARPAGDLAADQSGPARLGPPARPRRHDLDRPEGGGAGRVPPRQDRGAPGDLLGAGYARGWGGGHRLHLHGPLEPGDRLSAHPGHPHLRLRPGHGAGRGCRHGAVERGRGARPAHGGGAAHGHALLREPAPDGSAGAVGARAPHPHASLHQGDGGGGPAPPTHPLLPRSRGGRGGKFRQWDGKQWTVLTDWSPTDQALVRPLVEASAARYAQEKGITPRDCP